MYENERKELIQKLAKSGIKNVAVLKAMFNVDDTFLFPKQ